MQDFFSFLKKKIKVGCRLNAMIEKKIKNKVCCKINAVIEKIYNLEPNFLPDFVFGSICNNDLTTLNC